LFVDVISGVECFDLLFYRLSTKVLHWARCWMVTVWHCLCMRSILKVSAIVWHCMPI